ncbi:MAG TPA: NAD-dependent epimerase/dehydratase family protein [Zeimonas sp.]|nr:NAD-dependent epimerase/dehydratase family protein [Zeimonas sp.]
MHALITGANGHLGYNLVARLLADGHRVRGSVRSLDDPSRTARRRALGDIELVEARLAF